MTFFNRYYGTLRPETPFAHTNPVYITVGNKPVRSRDDAQYFIKYLERSIAWLQQSGRFPSEQAKQEVLETFNKGIEMYRDLAK
jgi:hypothetical protein